MTSVPAVLLEETPFDKPAGTFCYTQPFEGEGPAGINYQCPCGCGAIHGISFKGHGHGHAEWDWDGNREKPTCSPSLGLYPKDGKARDGSGYHWHGYLRNGVFEPC